MTTGVDPVHDGAVAEILRAFPGTAVVSGYDTTPATRRAWARWYFRTLWGDQAGYACIALGHGGHFDQSGAYRFQRFDPRFLRWPTEAVKVVELTVGASEGCDVYAAPLLRSSPSRKRETALAGRFVWADVDGAWTVEASAKLAPLWCAGSFTVASGTGGRHVYIRLREPVLPQQIEDLNRRLAAHLDGDAKWDAATVLRPPGTRNHKNGALVTWGTR